MISKSDDERPFERFADHELPASGRYCGRDETRLNRRESSESEELEGVAESARCVEEESSDGSRETMNPGSNGQST